MWKPSPQDHGVESKMESLMSGKGLGEAIMQAVSDAAATKCRRDQPQLTTPQN